MTTMTKRFKALQGVVTPGKTYPVDDALRILKDHSKVKFVESVDVAVRLGIDAKKSDQGVRGSTLLPNGTGKTVRVAVFCPRVRRPMQPRLRVPTRWVWTIWLN